jgi:uncharacterized protein involved in outer membrane biogenesis
MPNWDQIRTNARERASAAWTHVRAIKRPSGRKVAWGAGITAGVLAVIVISLGLFDWNYLKGPVERVASAKAGRTVKIDGNLSVKLLSWTPSASIEGLRVANPAWVPGGGEMTRIRKLDVSVKLLPLFRGRVILPLLHAENPDVVLLRASNGDNNWSFGSTKKQPKPFSLPPIQKFEIIDGRLRLDDAKRKMTFDGKVNSSEVEGTRTIQAFRLLGDGKLNGEDFAANITGGSLLNVDPDKPYPFSLDLRAGPSRAIATGAIDRPFSLARFSTTLNLQGPDLARLYYLTGLTLPNTPPYKVSGRLTRTNNLFEYTGINGVVGDSDLHGALSVKAERPRPFLTADLTSKKLDFDDLSTILGGAPSRKGAISPEQAQIAAKMAASGRLFPDAPLDVSRLRSMDAKVKYSAVSVQSSALPLRKASMNLTLDNGLLTMDPVLFGFTRGEIGGKVAINARQEVPVIDMDVRLKGARVEQFIPAKYAGAITAGIGGRAKLTARGSSVRDAAAHANGQVTIVGSQGEMRAALAELLGVNVVKGVGLLLSGSDQKAELRCAVADFKARDGVLTAQTIVLDTTPTVVRGGGTIDLKDERLALRVKGDPKKPQLIRLQAPITLTGPMRSPKIGVAAGPAVGQAGIGVVIGALLNPLAAIIPFLDGGEADDVNCAALGAPTPKPAAAREPVKTGKPSKVASR